MPYQLVTCPTEVLQFNNLEVFFTQKKDYTATRKIPKMLRIDRVYTKGEEGGWENNLHKQGKKGTSDVILLRIEQRTPILIEVSVTWGILAWLEEIGVVKIRRIGRTTAEAYLNIPQTFVRLVSDQRQLLTLKALTKCYSQPMRRVITKILRILNKNQKTTRTTSLAKWAGVGTRTAKKALLVLEEEGIVRRRGHEWILQI